LSARDLRDVVSSWSGDESTESYGREYQEGDLLNGRYKLLFVLGAGTFGTVFLGTDTKIERRVAVKVFNKNSPKARGFTQKRQLEEAKVCGNLNHPNIVTIYDAGIDKDGDIFIVCQYIDCTTLQEELDKQAIDHQQIATIVLSIAQALYAVSDNEVIHRDIKPANILIERKTRKVYVTDFGLAVREDDDDEKRFDAGSPPYKSPEQVRREGHRIDGRSDLFSLGIVMYEMLTREKPFKGQGVVLKEQIKNYDPPNPSTLKLGIPRELDRICMKLLQKDPLDRYSDGQVLADDLQAWLASQEQSETNKHDGPAAIQPRGLRSFTESDSDFFLELLPGLRDRHGIPESVSFWTDRIQTRDPAKAFCVGMIMGPSGSGKSSLVKAGIVPLLSNIVAIHLDATPANTESRLLKALQDKLPGLQDTATLSDAMIKIRRSEDPKVVVFIDQFEQWLSANPDSMQTELTSALRQCDGKTLQAVLVVRDDFGAAVQFMTSDLETLIDQGSNFASLRVFDADHAKKVLTKFGQAYQKLPKDPEPLSPTQSGFIDRAIAELGESSKDHFVIPVQLSLFAEMMKFKPWATSSLDSVGGASGVLGAFLDESFGLLNPQNRIHQSAAQGLLKALLPAVGVDLKGQSKSKQQLMESCGYKDRPADFQSLLEILDRKLRLIKPSEGQAESYQLTHDYLIAPLREWLSRKQRETLRGRSELVLAERAEAWTTRKESKQLPTFLEWLKIRLLTRSRSWTSLQRAMMKRSDVQNLSRIGWFLTACVFLVGTYFFTSMKFQQERIVHQWLYNSADNLVVLEGQMQKHSSYIDRELQDYLRVNSNPTDSQKEKTLSEETLRANLGLMLIGSEKKPEQIERVFKTIISKPQRDFLAYRNFTSKISIENVNALLDQLDAINNPQTERISAAALIAAMKKNDNSWLTADRSEFIARAITASNIEEFPGWINTFSENNLGVILLPDFQKILKEGSKKNAIQHVQTAQAIAKYARNKPSELAEAVIQSTKESYPILLSALKQSGNGNDKNTAALKSIYDRESKRSVKDLPTKNALNVDEPIKKKILAHGGMISQNHAFVANILSNEFQSLTEELKKFGYRPTRIRPFTSTTPSMNRDSSQNIEMRVAAVFARDSRDFLIRWDFDPIEIPDERTPAERKIGQARYILEDIAVTTRDNAGKAQFMSLWIEADSHEEERFVLIDLDEESLVEKDKSMREFFGSIRLSVNCDNERKRRFSVIYQKGLRDHILHLGHDGSNALIRPQVDISGAETGKTPLRDQFSEKLSEYKQLTENEKSQTRMLNPLFYTIAFYKDRDFQTAFDIAEEGLGSKPNFSPLTLFRLLASIHLKVEQDANSEFSKYIASVPNEADKIYAEIRFSFVTQGFVEAKKKIDHYMERYSSNPYYLLSIICAASGCASEAIDESVRDELKSFVFSHLEPLLSHQYFTLDELLAESDLALFYQDPFFEECIRRSFHENQLASISDMSPVHETILFNLDDADSNHSIDSAKMDQLIAEQWYPKAIACFEASNLQLGLKKLRTFVLFERTFEPNRERDSRLKRAALALLALHHLGDSSQAIELLGSFGNDETMRNYFQASLIEFANVVPPDISVFVNIFSDYSARSTPIILRSDILKARSVAITLGDFAEENLLSEDVKKSIRTIAEKLFREDLDAGIHSSCEWLLLETGGKIQLHGPENGFSSYARNRSKGWFLTETNSPSLEHTMAIVGPGEFIAGSPLYENDREKSPDGFSESQYYAKIPYRIAIATHETTARQYRRFSEHPTQLMDVGKGDDDAPVHGVTWFEAAAYCNWLSQQEGIPEEQWCYVKREDGAFIIPDDFLYRKGYRLPTRQEFEYACRCGTLTSRPFGDSKELLPRFAWFVPREGEQCTTRVGELRPNPWGFFDLLGNVEEWTSDVVPFNETLERRILISARKSLNRNPSVAVYAKTWDQASLYGGSYNNSTRMIRAASRHDYVLATSFDSVGFRVAKTIRE
jgi:serine/threonine protein kinase/formylglycine-generating enzyme required for sulfatase activity